jgi:hypothetical protein
MTLKRILTFDVNRVLRYDVNQVLRGDVGVTLTVPLKAICGCAIGVGVLGLTSMVTGWMPHDAVSPVVMLLFAVGAIASDLPSVFRRKARRRSR